MVELIAVEALGTIIGAMENRRAIGRLDDGFGTVRSNVDELQLDAAVDVARLAIRIDELEAATGAVENVGHAVLGIAVRDDEKADLVARVQGDFCSALVRLQITARTFQRCVRPQDLDAGDGAIRTVRVHTDGILVASRLAVEDDVALEIIRDHDVCVAFNGLIFFAGICHFLPYLYYPDNRDPTLFRSTTCELAQSVLSFDIAIYFSSSCAKGSQKLRCN